MRFIFCLAAVLAFVSSPALSAAEWYEGGTLQKGAVSDWTSATPEDQLATSADFIASLSGVKDVAEVKDARALADIKKRSEDLKICIDDLIAKGDLAQDKRIAELVILCTILKKTGE